MHRRTFVQALGASLATGPWASRGGDRAGRLARIGLELYSVRDAMRRDPDRTLAAVRAMGYTDVELLWTFGNFGRTTEQVRAALDREGLRAPSAHVSPTILFVGWDRSLAIAHRLGHEYLIVPSFTADTARSLDDWREWADRFNTAGAAACRHLARLPQRARPHDADRREGAVRRVPGANRPERRPPPARRRQHGNGRRRSARLSAAVPRPLLELPSQGRRRRSVERHRAGYGDARFPAPAGGRSGHRPQAMLRRAGGCRGFGRQRAPGLRVSQQARVLGPTARAGRGAAETSAPCSPCLCLLPCETALACSRSPTAPCPSSRPRRRRSGRPSTWCRTRSDTERAG